MSNILVSYIHIATNFGIWLAVMIELAKFGKTPVNNAARRGA